jgi:hypothetical protein
MKMLWLIGVTALIALIGCTPSDRSLNHAEKRIESLRQKGVPDSALSEAKVFLYGVRDAKRLHNNSVAWEEADSLRHALTREESYYNNYISKLGPAIDSLVSLVKIANLELTGLQKKKLEKAKAVVDSFSGIKWHLQAYMKAQELVNLLSQLKTDESNMKEIKGMIPGEWVCVNVIKGQENKAINATETKIFTFQKDGNGKFVERKKGQSGPFLREDWEFVSTGPYDFKGDTICLFVNRFAAVRQMMERYTVEGNKKYWKQEPGATYDSAITDGSQDRFITFKDLKEDFKQAQKY